MPVSLLCMLLCVLAPMEALSDRMPVHLYGDFSLDSGANAFYQFLAGGIVTSLILTIIIEGALLAALFKHKKIVDSILINCVTNPVANVTLLLVVIAMHAAAHNQHAIADYHPAILVAAFVVIECVVIWVETMLLRKIGVPKPFVTSLILNVASASSSWIVM